MRLLIIAAVLTCVPSFAQSFGQADLKKVEILNSTSLALLDNSAAIITSNPNVKEFSINTENLASISFDGNLFSSNIQGLEYYGFGNEVKDIKSFTMKKIHRPMLSGAYSHNDSIAKVAIGIKFNVFTLYNATSEKMQATYTVMRKNIEDLDERAHKQVQDEVFSMADPVKYEARLKEVLIKLAEQDAKDREIKAKEFSDILKAPLLTLDIASAYSMLMPADNFNKSQAGRFGAWSTLTVTLGEGDNHLKLYGFCRYLKDNAEYDSESNEFTDHIEYFDYGSKAQLDLNKFSLGYEYIKRNGDGRNFRSVGFAQYKVSDNLYITGGFGKNFESELVPETVSLLGIRWGINTKDIRDWNTTP